MRGKPARTADELHVEMDPDTEPVYCSSDGLRLEKSGHLTSSFLLCPVHGEFTIAPIVIKLGSKWFFAFEDQQAKSMWKTARYVNEQELSGPATRVTFGESDDRT